MPYKNKKKNKGTRKKTNKKYILNVSEGGAAFIKGGYGCIFRPAISCVGHKRRPNYISKLLTNEYAKREYDYISKINSRLTKLPVDVKKYLLLDNIEMCEPGKLGPDDLKNIETICGDTVTRVIDETTKQSINSYNINDNLNKFKIINMPELGISLHDFMDNNKLDPGNLIEINNIIITYVLNVLPYLNKAGVVHGDIKAPNILFSKENVKIPILIDWGLSYVSNNDKKSIPDDLYTLRIQWQHPFSAFLFSRDVVTQYVSFLNKLKQEKIKITRESIRIFVIALFSNFKKRNTRVSSILKLIFSNSFDTGYISYVKDNTPSARDKVIEQMFSNYFINYVLDVLIAYTTNIGESATGSIVLDLGKYFNDVYLYNVDMWGIVSIFYQYLLFPSTKFNMPINEYKIFTHKIMDILIENVFVNGNKIIDSEKLVKSIRNLNSYLKSIGEMRNKYSLSGIKEQLKSSNITGNILFFKSVEDSIMLRKARMSNRDRLKSVKIGGRYTSRRNRISRATRRKAVK
jgi:tRNA A-37 threonylcarbamoyl transferase component Bud32